MLPMTLPQKLAAQLHPWGLHQCALTTGNNSYANIVVSWGSFYTKVCPSPSHNTNHLVWETIFPVDNLIYAICLDQDTIATLFTRGSSLMDLLVHTLAKYTGNHILIVLPKHS